MPSLKDLLQKTMLFTAARDPGGDAYTQAKIDVKDALDIAPPAQLDPAAAEDRKVWGWKHDPGQPALITNLRAFSPAMNMIMTVCERVEVEDVTVVLDGTSDAISLPLRPAFIAAKYRLDSGQITAKNSGWWQLESHTDDSLLVVFAYELTGSGDAGIKPLSLTDIEALGSNFFPAPDVDPGDPDGPDVPATPTPASDPEDATVPDAGAPEAGPSEASASASPGESVKAHVAATMVVVAFGFTTCKEATDFEPGNVLGAGRIYPHVMITCNHTLAKARATLHLKRPPTIPQHPDVPEMGTTLGPLLVTDSNTDHGTPLPIWSNVFNYVVADPVAQIGLIGGGDRDGSGSNWMTVVDPTKGPRIIKGQSKRETRTHVPDLMALDEFDKVARQGEFDNIHIAPPLRLKQKDGTVLDTIKMAPFCEHDCLHTHFRWGKFIRLTLAGHVPFEAPQKKQNKGFSGRRPYSDSGEIAPLVPANQTVRVGLTSASSFRYLAEAAGPIKPATWTVIYHHGSGYSLEITDRATVDATKAALQLSVATKFEPFAGAIPVPMPPSILPPVVPLPIVMDVDPLDSDAAFYQRLRFTGTTAAGGWIERLTILDLAGCRA